MDLKPFVGENVHIVLDRRSYHREYVGRLTAINKDFICIERIDGRNQWINRPNSLYDTIEKVNK